jgi:hypothetical protein
MFSMLLNWGSDVAGAPSDSVPAFCNGMGTSEEEKGVAPDENGTLGLLVELMGEPLPENEVMNEPANKRLDAVEFSVMERTLASAPESPPNGGADHDLVFGSYMATAEDGVVNFPPAQSLLFFWSQNKASTSPSGPPDAKVEKLPDDESYAATFCASTEEDAEMEEKEPAM